MSQREPPIGKRTSASEQIARVARYYRKLKEYDSGIPPGMLISEEHRDLVYAFFLNCYHLKDWIKHDPDLSPIGDVENFINTNRELRLCADICNSNKHFKITRPRSSDSPEVGTFQLIGTPQKVVLRFEIMTTSGPVDTFEVATKCVKAWSRYLRLDVASHFGLDVKIGM